MEHPPWQVIAEAYELVRERLEYICPLDEPEVYDAKALLDSVLLNIPPVGEE
jgi:hypothetical protein